MSRAVIAKTDTSPGLNRRLEEELSFRAFTAPYMQPSREIVSVKIQIQTISRFAPLCGLFHFSALTR